MAGKLGLVGGVGVAWLLTFVLMGGDVLPALSADDSPAASPSATVTSAPVSLGSITPSPTSTKAVKRKKIALSAEALAGSIPIGGKVLDTRPKPRRSAPPVLTFRIATYNILGSSHTARNGPRSGTTRAARGTQYVLDNNFSVVGFQEFQADQRATFRNRTNNSWGMYPDNQLRRGDGDNTLAWREADWELISTDNTPIPYFGGRPRNIPIVLLRHRQTGIEAYFTNFHNPADKFGKVQGLRNEAKRRQIALFRDLARTGRPVFVTGDMNERNSWGCQIAVGADMRMAAGGHGRGGCSVTTSRVVDWVGASYGVQFSNYVEDRSSIVDYLTDHPIIWADARIDSRDYPRSVTR